ncbi:MAG: hypothetical protein AAGC55_23240 [Myxococcota bacterium]
MPGKGRIFIAIHLFLAVQLAVPLSYYTCRSDENDERFAWRMFSSIRMKRCQPIFRLGDERTPVRLGSTFHEAWITLARRGRQQVIVAMAEELCKRHPDQPVRVEVQCMGVDGNRETLGGKWDMCELGLL